MLGVFFGVSMLWSFLKAVMLPKSLESFVLEPRGIPFLQSYS
ncbi:hypothetical protein HMPREF0322_04298 [Desulfitobacterium hafniense DP7]|uniref:Uncharacterized protein n=1 Tax=Desulfitobacterium hafniense DP7 TaxID=537010 RepID=G9XTJ1_DESHA|nr:hypothetical protein HMPREF0322_04298 [Desulfitobacterium hafniense DP7]